MSEVRRDACIYLDNHSTTEMDRRVAAVMTDALYALYGNPRSGYHLQGRAAAAAVEHAREHVASLVNAEPEQVLFTSSSTEALRLALEHAVASGPAPLRVLTSPTEHMAVIGPLQRLGNAGAIQLGLLEVDRTGRVEIDAVLEAASVGCDLGCIMHANNEIGTVADIESLASALKSVGVALLCDATQSVGRLPVDVKALGVTYLAFSGHKLNGPKGVGALVADERLLDAIPPGATPNVPAIIGMGEACRIRRTELESSMRRVAALRDELQARLIAAIPNLAVNGDVDARLPGNLHVSIPGVSGEAIIARLADTVAISDGAACSAGSYEASHVLVGIGLAPRLIEGSLRFGVGPFNTREEIERGAAFVIAAVRDLNVETQAAA